jgi:metal transporter CNNM
MEALPIFLHQIVPAAYAVLISTIVVVLVGEIIPQALCTGPA